MLRVLCTCAMLALLAPAGCAASGDGLLLRFWAGEGAERDPRVVKLTDHCCCTGHIAIARTARLPSPAATGPLQSELVVEFDGTGAITVSWPLPVDLYVAGVRGERILVPLAPIEDAGSDRAVLISPDGAVRLTTMPGSLAEPVWVSCPDAIQHRWGGSAYVRCFEFSDLETGRARRLAFEGPCT